MDLITRMETTWRTAIRGGWTPTKVFVGSAVPAAYRDELAKQAFYLRNDTVMDDGKPLNGRLFFKGIELEVSDQLTPDDVQIIGAARSAP